MKTKEETAEISSKITFQNFPEIWEITEPHREYLVKDLIQSRLKTTSAA
jgi:hypothetical protein